MWICPYFGTHDGMSAPLIYYDILQNDHLEVKVGSCYLGSQIFEKKIENGFTMGLYPCLEIHDNVCVLLI